MRNWRIDAEGLSNVAIKLIIDKYGYREEKHGAFDQIIGSGRGRTTIPNERIGKKYQWLALHELLARVADNFPMLESSWSDNIINYDGPWSPMVRDIDPTTRVLLDEFKDDANERDFFWWYGGKYANWEMEISDWLNVEDDVPPAELIIELKDPDGCDWLALECYPDWEEPHCSNGVYKKLWYQIRSCIIDEKEFPRVYEWASQQNFGGRWMQECSNRYELFYREYYWSPAYKSYDVSGLTKRDIYDNITNLFISHVELTSIGYLWEAEEDHSKDKSCFCLMPSLQLFDGMGMQYSDEDGVFLNKDGEAICFDVSAIERSNNNLLIRKNALLDYLKIHHKRILWYVLGEKNIIGLHNYQSIPNLPMWLVVSGSYTLDETGKLVGSLRTSHEI